ncbi:MAG: 3-deoxy-manno-octulosonate cytidylyltransferase [Candidatus Kaelpia aquatica]|nr:3-deoxy-manno-octulosonate cytidylyltransferase [Candidatus Kaelpia aquatica]
MEVVAVIPAHLDSKRLSRKVLRKIKGKSLIEHVYSRVKESKLIEKVYVASSDREVIDQVVSFGGEFIRTAKVHNCGTSRVSEASSNIDADIIINVQADEPLISYELLDQMARYMIDNKDIEILTPVKKITELRDINDKNVVKAVFSKDNKALCFSRLPIPHDADEHYKHIGIYCFRKSFLLSYPELEESNLDKAEKLEQLRFLYNGYRIAVFVTEYETIGVDTEEDLKKVEEILSWGK